MGTMYGTGDVGRAFHDLGILKDPKHEGGPTGENPNLYRADLAYSLRICRKKLVQTQVDSLDIVHLHDANPKICPDPEREGA
jgi:hypothetical protein